MLLLGGRLCVVQKNLCGSVVRGITKNATKRSRSTPAPFASSVPIHLQCPCSGPVYCWSSPRLLSQFPLHSTNGRRKTREKKHFSNKGVSKESESLDDLKTLMQSKSMSLTAKFKLLFQQYGVVLVVVHCITAAFWLSIFYYAVSRGFDIVPFMEKYGVFDFLERIGLPASDKLKSPGASNILAAYLLYEVAKPIRYPVTIIGTIYAVRFLRRLGHLKRPPPSQATVTDLVKTQGKIVRHQFNRTANKYKDRYRRPNGKKSRANGIHKVSTKKK